MSVKMAESKYILVQAVARPSLVRFAQFLLQRIELGETDIFSDGIETLGTTEELVIREKPKIL